MAYTLQELLEVPADPEYFLSFPLLPRGGRIVIGAPAKHFKSMLAVNLAYDLTEAEPLWGIKKQDGGPLWEVKRPYRVLYVEKEIGRYRLRERLKVIHSVRAGELAPMNLHIEPKGSRIMLDTHEGLQTLVEQLEKTQPDVLILDPLRKFHTQDEDSSTSMVGILTGLDELQRQNRDLTVILVHHTAKRSKERDPRDPESLRGSSVVFDDADTAIIVTRPNVACHTTIALNFTLRSAADPKPLILDFDEATYGFTEH